MTDWWMFIIGMICGVLLLGLVIYADRESHKAFGFDDDDDMLTSPTHPFSMNCWMGSMCLNPISPGYQLSHKAHATPNYSATLQDMDVKLPSVRVNSIGLWAIIAVVIAIILVFWWYLKR